MRKVTALVLFVAVALLCQSDGAITLLRAQNPICDGTVPSRVLCPTQYPGPAVWSHKCVPPTNGSCSNVVAYNFADWVCTSIPPETKNGNTYIVGLCVDDLMRLEECYHFRTCTLTTGMDGNSSPFEYCKASEPTITHRNQKKNFLCKPVQVTTLPVTTPPPGSP
jgi:hypothetical protein